ncbi:hypothetical protein Tco_1174036 [Tanacetum coccineum]
MVSIRGSTHRVAFGTVRSSNWGAYEWYSWDIDGVGRDIDVVKWMGRLAVAVYGETSSRFPRLFHLDSRLEGRVAEKGRLVEGVWRWEWLWIMELRGRASGEMEGDQWWWNLKENGGFTIKDLTSMVEERTL